MLTVSKIEVQGFRAFGKVSQTLDFNSLIACIWGPNSQGKTSLAEAFEFLLTGQIVRRELLASGQDEFADALRNVHMPKALPCFVRATFMLTGKPHVVTRTLIADYGKRQDCQTALDIDDKAATETDLVRLGIILSQPPLRAPVLAQHTLGYLFSARPQDRASYFKALLEVTDLEDLRAAVAAVDATLKAPEDRLAEALAAATGITAAAAALRPLTGKVPSPAAVTAAIDAAHNAVIAGEGGQAPATTEERIAACVSASSSNPQSTSKFDPG
jgi:DNA repair exonuclease SbcCD ATPase subunit